MAGNRPRFDLVVSALGAIVLAVSVFLPWYGLSFTASGVAYAEQVGAQVVSQFGNAPVRGLPAAIHAQFGALAGHQFAALSAHQVLSDLNVVLLVVAGLAILLALAGLVGLESSSLGSHRAPLGLLGTVAAVGVLYRIAAPPTPDGGFIALSLREGAWLALCGSLAIVAGALWPQRTGPAASMDLGAPGAWSDLSGWTPEG